MATDYDAPRKRDEENPEESLEELKTQRKIPKMLPLTRTKMKLRILSSCLARTFPTKNSQFA